LIDGFPSSVLAEERAAPCCSDWGVCSFVKGPFICHFFLRKWQNEVLGDQLAAFLELQSAIRSYQRHRKRESQDCVWLAIPEATEWQRIGN
jgi:hypothetical protein